MKRLEIEISELMDQYRDNEFFPEDGCAADPGAVKERVLARLKVPARRKRRPAKNKLLIAAALAAVLLMVGAGFRSVIYSLANTTLRFEQGSDSRSVSYNGAVYMYTEGGRLFFALEDTGTDITDLVSDDTPYIYDGSDPESGTSYYLILGGTPEGYGWLEWIAVPNPFTSEEGAPAWVTDEEGRMVTYHFTSVTYDEQGERHCSGLGGVDALDWAKAKDYPWLIAGAKQLSLPFVDSGSRTDEVFYAP